MGHFSELFWSAHIFNQKVWNNISFNQFSKKSPDLHGYYTDNDTDNNGVRLWKKRHTDNLLILIFYKIMVKVFPFARRRVSKKYVKTNKKIDGLIFERFSSVFHEKNASLRSRHREKTFIDILW